MVYALTTKKTIMEDEKENNNFKFDIGFWIAVMFGAIVIGLAILFRHDDTEEIYKSDLSKRYGVTDSWVSNKTYRN